ncbi:NUMOD4 domain-containing protein [Chryseobacterium sp. 2987]|uniref:NUMOD4 domain-containing protein n=1 Tax=Chryseobacterium sp. 2987 TaxID=2817767 RepID=UPI00285F1009|nr:NUMOD4 domain-containing protein [Chryseobacterium sp. 2987]MDR6923961.1 hypothetical protein [Chryseobacterium sp. 2987]
MNLPSESVDPYLKEVLYNTSLEDLAGEEWILIQNIENYAISNYGRVKSLERWIPMVNGGRRKDEERIMKLSLVKYSNNYLQRTFYNVFCGFSLNGIKFRRSVARLVYYHFVEKFDMDDHSIAISYKDNNSFNLFYNNLEMLSMSELNLKKFRNGRACLAKQAVNQYTVQGKHVASYESILTAAKVSGASAGGIISVLQKTRFSAGGFRWFPKEYVPQEKDFLKKAKSTVLQSNQGLNISLWEKLGKPLIDFNSPPACMNLSLSNLSGEQWKDIPEFVGQYMISNKGRVKRKSGWAFSSISKIFVGEKIMPLKIRNTLESKNIHLSVTLRKNGKEISIAISRLLYYSFVQEFDLSDRRFVVDNQSEVMWDIEIPKLSLKPIYSLRKNKKG